MTYGETLKLVDGDLVYNSMKRLEMISGEEKTAQDLNILITTQVGEDIFHPVFGFDMLEVMTTPLDVVVKRELNKALMQYHYLSKIESIELVSKDYENREVTVKISVVLTGGETISTTVVL